MATIDPGEKLSPGLPNNTKELLDAKEASSAETAVDPEEQAEFRIKYNKSVAWAKFLKQKNTEEPGSQTELSPSNIPKDIAKRLLELETERIEKEKEAKDLKSTVSVLEKQVGDLIEKQRKYWEAKRFLLSTFAKIVNAVSQYGFALLSRGSFNRCDDCKKYRICVLRYKEIECNAQVCLCPFCLVVAKDRFGLKLVRIKSPWQLATKG